MAQKKKRTVYFVTNRNPAGDGFGSDFSHAGIDDLRFGKVLLWETTSGKKRMEIVTADEKLNAQDQSASPVLGSATVLAELQDGMRTSKKDSLVFLHGYGVSFESAIRTADALRGRHAATFGQVAVFSWPSDGRLVPWHSYKKDRTDARASGPALGRALLKTADFVQQTLRDHRAGVAADGPCRGEVHLLAHSMGNYVLRHAFQEIRKMSDGTPRRLFKNVFMMAADEDHDTFEHEHKLRSFATLAHDVHVYFNRGDRALDIADVTKMNPNRLGSDGPHHPLDVPGNVHNVDVSDVIPGLVEHDYYVTSAPVRRDINAVLAGGRPDRVSGRRYLASQNRYVLKA